MRADLYTRFDAGVRSERGNSVRTPRSGDFAAVLNETENRPSSRTATERVPYRDGNAARQDLVAGSSENIPLSLSPNPFNPYGRKVTRESETVETSEATAVLDGRTPMEKLQDEMQSRGISTEGLTFTEERGTISSLAGAFERWVISVDLGNGRKVNFDAALTGKHAWLTALEISKYRDLPVEG